MLYENPTAGEIMLLQRPQNLHRSVLPGVAQTGRPNQQATKKPWTRQSASHLPSHLHRVSIMLLLLPRPIALPMTQQVRPLKVRIRMHNRIQLRSPPRPVPLHPLNVGPVRPIKHPVARDVVPLLLHVLPNPLQHVAVPDARRLQQGRQVIDAEVPVGAPVALPAAGRVLGQNLLAGERRVAAAAADRVATDVAVGVPDVVAVLLVEGVVGDKAEGVAPEG